MAKKASKRKKPGPKADTLKIEGDWKDAIRRAVRAPKPPGGWSKPQKRKPAKGGK